MPYTPAQHRLFEAVAHGSLTRKGLSRGTAAKLAREGVKKPSRRQMQAKALKGY